METATAAAAQCHYQSGRYRDALLELDRCERLERSVRHANQAEPLLAQVVEKNDCREQDNGWITADDVRSATDRSDSTLRIRRAELIALPQSARWADMAMCRFRCVMQDPSKLTSGRVCNEVSTVEDHSNGTPSTLWQIWKDALQTNDNYRRALNGAASSLILTCFREMEHVHRIKNQQDVPSAIQSPSQPAEILVQNRNREHNSIQREMKSTAVAILMAGVASCHLLLHDDVTRTDLDEQRSDNKAWNVLVLSSIAASNLLSVRKEFIYFCSSGETIEKKHYVRENSLESSLQILNENLDDERSSVALHSFRMAIKVAALACGKLVLPKVALQKGEKEEEVEQRQGKRKTGHIISHQRKDIVPPVTLIRENDAWNVVYHHCNVALRSRERMVDALSFHLAAIHCTAKRLDNECFSDSSLPTMISELFQKRDLCLDEAIRWESKLNALVGDATFLSLSSEESSGYVWKICSCLRGLSIVGSRQESILSTNIKDCNTQSILQAMDRLALSSTSRFACFLMGCVHVRSGNFSRAIDMYRLSLERGDLIRDECSNVIGGNPRSYRDIDADVEMSYTLEEHRIISNIASCFVAMGDANTPLELLLHLWTTLNESKSNSNTEPRPRALLLSYSSNVIEKASNVEPIITDSTRIKLLWMLFHVSSLASDWATCLAAAEELTEHEKTGEDTMCRVHINVAHAFALLQCRREKQSQEIALTLIRKLNTYDTLPLMMSLVSALTELYIADGSLMLGHALGATGNDSSARCTRRAMAYVDGLISSSVMKADDESILELRAVVLNNSGVACLVEGDACTALRCFRESSELLALAQTKMNAHLFWLSIPTHFNLSLLFLRDGRIDESARAWLSIRGHFNTWESAKRGDNDALTLLRDNHLLAMNRHGLIMAKRNVNGGSSDFFRDHKSVMEWVPPVLENQEWQESSACINGVDSAQVSTLDFILLTYALSVAERKASSLFRRKAGYVGY